MHVDWCKQISHAYVSRVCQPGIASKPAFYPPASAGDITEAEARLNRTFPASYRSLLLETNGVMEMLSIDEGEWFDSMWLLWTVAEVLEQNLAQHATRDHLRSVHNFQRLGFFAGAGTDGILFAFPVRADGGCDSDVLVWHPIRDEVSELAPSLEAFLLGWITGTITV